MTPNATRRLVVGNWKMNLGERAARELTLAVARSVSFDRVDVAVAPAFPCLRAVLDAAEGSPLLVGAQDVHWEERGAFTGEVAALMLAEMGIHFVIVGHSERRALFAETDAAVARKVAAACRHGLAPVLCVGETESQRDSGRTQEIVVAQVRAGLVDTTTEAARNLVVAYEPVWAIGTGRTPEPAEVTDAHQAIREALSARLGAIGGGVRILYGGSVTAKNSATLLSVPEVDGALVGGASLDAAAFAAIVSASG